MHPDNLIAVLFHNMHHLMLLQLSCCLVSSPGQIQMRMWAGGFSHYVIIYNTFAHTL